MKKFLMVFSTFVLCAFYFVLSTARADSTGCIYNNGNTAELNEVALDGSICQADGTWKNLEVTYPTSDADNLYNKGLSIGEKNNYAKAIEYILQAQKEYDGAAITGSDKNGLVNILLDLSYYYIKNEQYEEALRTANKVLKLWLDYRPDSKSIALNNKWAALDSLGSHTKGKGYYEQALDINYEFDTANDNLDYVNQLSYALDRMRENKITSIQTMEKFYPYDDMEKQYAAKYLTDFAKKIQKKTPNKKLNCKFYDLKKTEKNLKTFIVEACQLGLLSWVKGKFSPTAKITNEEFVTAIAKLIYGGQKDPYTKAQEELILDKLTGDDYLKKDDAISRGDAAILLYRAYDTTLPNHLD